MLIDHARGPQSRTAWQTLVNPRRETLTCDAVYSEPQQPADCVQYGEQVGKLQSANIETPRPVLVKSSNSDTSVEVGCPALANENWLPIRLLPSGALSRVNRRSEPPSRLGHRSLASNALPALLCSPSAIACGAESSTAPTQPMLDEAPIRQRPLREPQIQRVINRRR